MSSETVTVSWLEIPDGVSLLIICPDCSDDLGKGANCENCANAQRVWIQARERAAKASEN